MLEKLGACFKCLLKHEIGECKKRDCPYCGGPHNLLLCYKKENAEKKRKSGSNAPTQKGSGKTNQGENGVSRPNMIPAGAEDDWGDINE